jgi:hypothetical protein
MTFSARAGFPWLAVAGKALTGCVAIDLDATLITAMRPSKARWSRSRRVRVPYPRLAAVATGDRPSDQEDLRRRIATILAGVLSRRRRR